MVDVALEGRIGLEDACGVDKLGNLGPFVVDKVKSEWPVDSGRSFQEFDGGFLIRGGVLIGPNAKVHACGGDGESGGGVHGGKEKGD